jgi:hypothetical protein
MDRTIGSRRKGKTMVRKSQSISISTLLAVTLLSCTLLTAAAGQTAQSTQSSRKQITPLSLPHLYWHFLVLQHYLDTKAAAQEAQGKDGSGLRKRLQTTLGWSDADYAPMRTSSVRLTQEVTSLDQQALTIRAVSTSAASQDQLKALTAQRETDINAEISFLGQKLSPDKKKTFETFLTRFFSPANASPGPPNPVGGPSAPAGVKP